MLTTVALSLLTPALVQIGLDDRLDDRVEQRGEELLHVYERMQALHPDLFFRTPPEDFEAAIDALYERLPEMSDDELVVELMRFVALVSREGRDGHSALWPFAAFSLVPMQLVRFEDGWFVVNARDAFLVGARLVAVGETSIEDACTAIGPLLTKDNDTTLLARLAPMLLIPELHHALGHTSTRERASFRFELASGEVSTRELSGVPFDEHRAWSGEPVAGIPPVPGALWLSRTREPWWMEVLEDADALYVQYNAVQAAADDGSSIADFAADVVRTFEDRELDRVVIDLRLNGGGNNGTFPPFIEALRASERLNRRGHLFALIGRHTFSAAGNFVTVFQRDLDSVLVGEPTGGAPNQYGDARTVPLLHHPRLMLRVSTRYHEYGGPEDTRLTHEPDLAVGMRAADYFAGRDPVLAAALVWHAGR